MERKYIYIIVSIITVFLVTANHIIELDSKSTPSTQTPGNLVVDEVAPSYKGAEISSPLVIRNYQNDERKLTYSYKIKVVNAVGAYRYEYNDTESYLVFNAIGESQFTIKSNETITIYDLPKEAEYEIIQTTDVSEKYQTKINNEETTTASGVLSLENNIDFYNETIKKVEEPVKENPTTADISTLGLICFITAAFTFICLKKIKVKRFDYQE